MLEVLRIIFMAALPISAIAFIMMFYTLKNGYVDLNGNVDDLKKRKKQAEKDKVDFNVNPIHRKWLFFGGGYYGLMALATYAHVEFIEVYEFFSAFSTFAAFIDQVTLGALIRLVIESFLNLFPAFTWFLYWPKIITMNNGWYWLGASYAGYHLGIYLANCFVARQSNTERSIV